MIALISVDGGIMSFDVDGFCQFSFDEVILISGQQLKFSPFYIVVGISNNVIRDS